MTCCLNAQEPTILDEEIKPLHFVELEYPLSARLAHDQGMVAVRVKLDAKGSVQSAAAIS